MEQLPAEIILMVASMVSQKDRYNMMLVCRQLYPFAQEALYCSPSLATECENNIGKFIGTLTSQPYLAKRVTSLILCCDIVKHKDCQCVQDLLHVPLNLKELSLYVTSRTWMTVLHIFPVHIFPDFPDFPALRGLEKLTLHTCAIDCVGCQLPNLTELSLQIKWAGCLQYSNCSIGGSSVQRVSIRRSVQRVSIRRSISIFYDSREQDETSDFLSIFTSLESLTIQLMKRKPANWPQTWIRKRNASWSSLRNVLLRISPTLRILELSADENTIEVLSLLEDSLDLQGIRNLRHLKAPLTSMVSALPQWTLPPNIEILEITNPEMEHILYSNMRSLILDLCQYRAKNLPHLREIRIFPTRSLVAETMMSEDEVWFSVKWANGCESIWESPKSKSNKRKQRARTSEKIQSGNNLGSRQTNRQ